MKRPKPIFKIGDKVHDFHTFGDGIGIITDIMWCDPKTNPQCWNGGYLYKHNGRGLALPDFVAKEFLEKIE